LAVMGQNWGEMAKARYDLARALAM
jgi:hypothetical protein